MQWNSVSEFLAMGGYGFYVWGSFGTTAVVMLAEMAHARLQRRALLQSLRSETLTEHGTS